MANASELSLTVQVNHDDSRKMQAVAWTGKKSVAVEERSVPIVTDAQDAILRVTSTAICGSDLHLYVKAMPGMKAHDILGHEFMGIIEDVGSGVTSFKKGDRVVACFDIGCGHCVYCKEGLFSSCDITNPKKGGMETVQEKLYNHRTAGIYGYTHMTGGFEGGQADYVRVPFADVNLLKIPNEGADEKYLFLSDILPTAWHANELAEVGKGDIVAIWGAGPVGILAAQCAQVRGAARVIIIDEYEYRLQRAKELAPGVETIDFSKKKTLEALAEMVPHGPHVALECVGIHYCKHWWNKVEMALMLETDPAETLNELIYGVRKGGRIGVIGAYGGFCNHFNIGAFMEKGLSMRAGQTPCQKYWKQLLRMIESGEIKPTGVITHEMPLSQAAEAYKMFNDKADECVKCVLKPGNFKPVTNLSSAEALKASE